MDNYYSLIQLKSANIILYLFPSLSDRLYPLCLICQSSDQMYILMDFHDVFLRLSLYHVLYLGQEIYKVELSLKLGQQYTQN